jgi:hypothetical protein
VCNSSILLWCLLAVATEHQLSADYLHVPIKQYLQLETFLLPLSRSGSLGLLG